MEFIKESICNIKSFYGCFKRIDGIWKPTKILENHFPNAFQSKEHLEIELINSQSMEYPDNYFNKKNLLNSNYVNFDSYDFEAYNHLLKKEYDKLQLNGNGRMYPIYRKSLLKEVIHGLKKPPLLLHGKNNVNWLLIGETQMITYKVLGISPFVKQINIDAEIRN